jgi:PAS domain S-box-containing protein
MALGIFHCQLLTDIREKIHYINDEAELSRIVLEQLSKTLNPGGGAIYKLSSGEKITPLAAIGVDVDRLRQIDFPYGRGVVGWIAKYNKPVKIDDAQTDDRFVGIVDVLTGIKTKNIVAAPVLLKGQTIGVIELINKTGSAFTPSDAEFVAAVGKELGTVFENASLIKNLEQSQTYLKAIVNGLNAGLMVVDSENRMQIINPRAAQILKIKPNQMQDADRSITELLSTAPQAMVFLKAVLDEKKTVPRGQVKVGINGAEIIIGYSAVPIKTEKDDYAGMTFLFQDITSYQNMKG